ncbi:MAG TPA: 16S rRNA (cytidine(1402)-2'-O)-methyltransferase [Acidimicrobiales bacterium]|nr:16S rRNA (cytidine(1402)-2'-O)-methyltransferase [Acidimicrobiales bacterium]
MSGALVLVATPIGNLGELSPRAVEVLASADVIACEDTRRTGRLLEHAGVAKRRLLVVNDHTEAAATRTVLGALDDGCTVVVVTDAGMPGISDPGERLVRAAVSAGHQVSVVAGPSAAIAALVVSGLPTGRFVFEGFLPRKGSGRTERLEALASERRTIVLYEAPHRVVATVADLTRVFGADRGVVLVRELTKLHEEVWRGSLGEAMTHLAEVPPRGEYVLVLAGAPEASPPSRDDIESALLAQLGAGVDRKTAIADVARAMSVPKRAVYDVSLGLRS